MLTWVQADAASCACPAHPCSLEITSTTFAAVICEPEHSRSDGAWTYNHSTRRPQKHFRIHKFDSKITILDWLQEELLTVACEVFVLHGKLCVH